MIVIVRGRPVVVIWVIVPDVLVDVQRRRHDVETTMAWMSTNATSRRTETVYYGVVARLRNPG